MRDTRPRIRKRHPRLSAALDPRPYPLPSGDAVCRLLREQGVPFTAVYYSPRDGEICVDFDGSLTLADSGQPWQYTTDAPTPLGWWAECPSPLAPRTEELDPVSVAANAAAAYHRKVAAQQRWQPDPPAPSVQIPSPVPWHHDWLGMRCAWVQAGKMDALPPTPAILAEKAARK